MYIELEPIGVVVGGRVEPVDGACPAHNRPAVRARLTTARRCVLHPRLR